MKVGIQDGKLELIAETEEEWAELEKWYKELQGYDLILAALFAIRN